MKATNLTIFVTPLRGEQVCIEKVCTVKQAVAFAKKEARKAIKSDAECVLVMMNILGRSKYGTIETISHIEALKEGRKVIFSDEEPAETYDVCWGDNYKEENGENNSIATTTSESEAKEIAEGKSECNRCRMCVVRKSDGKVVAFYDNYSEEINSTNMKKELEISLRYAGRGMDAIRDSFCYLKEVNDSIEITSTNTVGYEVDSEDENDIADALEDALISAGIPEDEYWFND